MFNRKSYMNNWWKANRDKKSVYNKKYREANPDHANRDTSVIYAIVKKSDHKICYIGETLKKLPIRIAKHKNDAFTNQSQYPIHKAMREHGWDEFEFVVIDDTVEFNPRFTEDYFIQMFNPMYNACGGNRVRKVRVSAQEQVA